ncbi:3-hydroxyacyl-CoA dehydrogenase [Serratia ficaria]|uniref:Probable 3-hydroxybutyryl-CoA dehydrogenase n=1 Tax=Serratia ficaria TaxID=61651 RepID=A0A240C5C2_SERFI|nr:3-hydroxyacyl-CoA dehydrogenase [Serratia ficaria]MEE4481604.1 3-hydroxyacyl-CoA dehydrogenase [Serratia ficaria]REF44103.1 3-hydroxybutyryl-CoA dehydrogenase [Serratia ficaria]CAI0739373.1 Probable 3-hydroxybutyryl-CoA dehydrogenase [Serratia ficaria]CAI0743404.1 Probable 3-hydroxybutyryl-CoA dehydrogenase [Serratia ficaria]CAI0759204.1 Probable 3-hydroxybutyryl-CoA dehydrogenase [Serratia ficaria]
MNTPTLNGPVAVIGAGTMGIGIAQVAAAAGHPVRLFDISAPAAQRALDGLAQRLRQRVAAGKADSAATEALLARIRRADSLDQLADSALVIEAVAESLAVKQSLFRDLEALCSPAALFASNTSSLSITAIAGALQHPQRMAGLHFFNPAPLMKLVEIVGGLETSAATLNALRALADRWGKQSVQCRSTPGFIVNRVARPFYAETLRALEERVADAATLDAVLRDAGGFAMGPLQLTDLIGQDINYAVTESVFQAFFQDPRFTPSLVQQELVAAGHLGRKSGRGFYRYGAELPAPAARYAPAEQGEAPQRVTLHGDWSPLADFAELLARNAAAVKQPGQTSAFATLDEVTFMLTNGKTASQIADETGTPVVLFDLSANYAPAPAVAISCAAQNEARHNAKAIRLLQSLGKRVILLPDYPGLLVMRTLAMLANEALDVVNKGVASAADTDLAMLHGVNYPRGPLGWSAALGWRHILATLENLQQFYGEARYRPMPLLRRYAAPSTAPSSGAER